MTRAYWRVTCLLVTILCSAAPAFAQAINAPRCGSGVHESEALGLVGFPSDQIFCPILADPKEPRSFASLLRGTFPSIEKPSGKRTTVA
jgi:hypothetical protein